MSGTPIAERDTLVEFQREIATESPLGVEQADAWTKIEGAWAKVRFGTSAERRDGAKTGSGQQATFRVLSTALLRGVTELDRIWVEARSEAWNVSAPGVPVANRAELEFTAVRSGA